MKLGRKNVIPYQTKQFYLKNAMSCRTIPSQKASRVLICSTLIYSFRGSFLWGAVTPHCSCSSAILWYQCPALCLALHHSCWWQVFPWTSSIDHVICTWRVRSELEKVCLRPFAANGFERLKPKLQISCSQTRKQFKTIWVLPVMTGRARWKIFFFVLFFFAKAERTFLHCKSSP